jgi:hypothetical protein
MAQENTTATSLRAVQIGLKVPKDRKNDFANFVYRKAEDIIQHAKPLLDKNGLTLVIFDELEYIGDRYYVKATAQVIDKADKTIACSAYAREALDKKGMDVAQITGSASSYARKYALSGLFAIDNSDIPDLDEQVHETPVAKPEPKAEKVTKDKFATATQKVELQGLMKQADIAVSEMKEFVVSVIGKERVETNSDYEAIKEALEFDAEPEPEDINS